jgi:hypothetical protein
MSNKPKIRLHQNKPMEKEKRKKKFTKTRYSLCPKTKW